MTAVTSAEERAAPDAQAGILASVALAANYNRWLLDRARPYLGARVLDSGAGIGTFTELLTDRELVVAAEPDPAFAGLLRDRFARRPNVQIVELDALALSPTSVPAPFDSVVCLNVLEHIRADEDALARLASVLRPDGHLLLLVPAHPTLFGAVDEAVGHVRRYTRAALRAAAEAAGLEIVEVRYVNPAGALGWLVTSRLLRRHDISRGPLALYDRLVPLLRPLDRLRLPFGLSLWMVARRPDPPSEA